MFLKHRHALKILGIFKVSPKSVEPIRSFRFISENFALQTTYIGFMGFHILKSSKIHFSANASYFDNIRTFKIYVYGRVFRLALKGSYIANFIFNNF